MNTLQRLHRVTDYIHDHLADELDLATLAEVACMSPYHWHRTYHAVFGETIAHTVRRIRLQRAGGYLANSSASVSDVARRCGYPNVQSFSRAFRASHGVSPLQFRKLGRHTEFTREADHPTGPQFDVVVRDVPTVLVAGLEHRGPYMLIGKAFETSRVQFVAQQLMRDDTRWLAVYFDDPAALEEKHLRSRAGLSLPEGARAELPLQPFELGGGPCAVLRYRGPYSSMHAAYRWLYGPWLLASGYEAANLPVFEEYLNSPHDTAPADLLTDIFLPLKLQSPPQWLNAFSV